MTSLPEGWRRLTPHQLAGEDKSALVIGPFGSSLKTVDYRPEGVPLVFVRDIRAADFHRPRHFVDDSKAAELKAHIVKPGDVLVTKMGDPPGDSCVYTGDQRAVITADCIRLRPTAEFDARYISYAMQAPDAKRQIELITSGVAQRKVSLARFRTGLTLPVPDLVEQRRIVDILEDHLSRLDSAGNYVRSAAQRTKRLVQVTLMSLIPEVSLYPARWESTSVGGAGIVELGRQRHPDWHHGPNMKPYLRVANVFEDRIDTTDVMEMHWPADLFERFKLHPGDVLLNEGQTPELLGRPALYRGLPEEVAFTNSLIRFKARDDVMPEFALLVFRRHMHAGRFTRESRITTNIAHLSARRLKPIEFPVPPMGEQKEMVRAADELLTSIDVTKANIARTEERSDGLRRALLEAAFAGRLTGRRSDLERAEELAGV